MTTERFDEIEPTPLPPVPEPLPEQGSGRLQWIGDSRSAQHSDGISDLYETGTEEDLEDTEELVEADLDTDILDTDEDGTMDSLVDVPQEEVIGGRRSTRRRFRPTYRPNSPGMGGINL